MQNERREKWAKKKNMESIFTFVVSRTQLSHSYRGEENEKNSRTEKAVQLTKIAEERNVNVPLCRRLFIQKGEGGKNKKKRWSINPTLLVHHFSKTSAYLSSVNIGVAPLLKDRYIQNALTVSFHFLVGVFLIALTKIQRQVANPYQDR